MDQIVLIFWIVLAVVLIIIEALNTGILAVWFAIGSAVAGVIAWLMPGSYLIQIAAFVIVSSVLTFIGTKIFRSKQFSESRQPVYSILGKTALVTKEIDNLNGNGKISVNGDVWSAKSNDDSIISENTKVKVLDIDGVKAVVEIIKE